jgi:hypothetical protein
MRAPADVLGDFRVLCILAKDRLGIAKFCFSQSQPFGFKGFRWVNHSASIQRYRSLIYKVTRRNIQEIFSDGSAHGARRDWIGAEEISR